MKGWPIGCLCEIIAENPNKGALVRVLSEAFVAPLFDSHNGYFTNSWIQLIEFETFRVKGRFHNPDDILAEDPRFLRPVQGPGSEVKDKELEAV